MYTGPHLIKDNLVFGYDTGYGVADNNTATRFYPGENTVNLLNYDNTMPIWPSNSSNMATLTSKTSARSFTVIGTCNVPGSMTFVYPSITTNTTFHTISATFTNNSSETSNVALYIRGASNATSTVNQSQTTTMQPGQSIRKTLIGNVLTANSGYTAAVGVWSHGTSGQVNMNVTDIQFEEKTHATPFVNGTRSSTQSLIDLKRTTDIDVSNVSFDSTGQPDFDGTDDRIVASPSNISLGTSLTYEVWIYPTGYNHSRMYLIDPRGDGNTSGTNTYFLFDYHQSPDTVHVVSGNSNIEVQSSNFSMPINNWHNIVATRNGNSWVIYHNGVSVGTGTTNTTALTLNNNFRIGTYSSGTSGQYFFEGAMAIAKIYNKGLSAQEVKQNYNAYKNRFGI